MSAALIDAHRLHGAFELLPICAEKAEDVAQPLQVSPPLSNSSPLCTMFQGGSSPKWNRIIIRCADCVPSPPDTPRDSSKPAWQRYGISHTKSPEARSRRRMAKKEWRSC
jgi:hypothetical protein